jgi:hypothetical protein
MLLIAKATGIREQIIEATEPLNGLIDESSHPGFHTFLSSKN